MLDAHIDQLLYQGTSQTKSQSKDDSGYTKLELQSQCGRLITSDLALVCNELYYQCIKMGALHGGKVGQYSVVKHPSTCSLLTTSPKLSILLSRMVKLQKMLVSLRISLAPFGLVGLELRTAYWERKLAANKRTFCQAMQNYVHGLIQTEQVFQVQPTLEKLLEWSHKFETSHLK